MATTITNTEMYFKTESERKVFLKNVYSRKTKPSNKNIAKTLEGMKRIKTLNIDGVKYELWVRIADVYWSTSDY